MIQVKPVPSAQSPHNKFYKGKREMEKEEKREFFFFRKEEKRQRIQFIKQRRGNLIQSYELHCYSPNSHNLPFLFP